MKHRAARPASIAALTILAAGPLVAAGTTVASAQNIVTTQKYVIGTGSVSGASAVAQPDTAGSTANYTIGFTTPSALSGGSATITLSDPTNSTTFPSSTGGYFVIDNTTAAADQPVSSATVAAGGHSVTLGLSSDVAAGSSLTVYVIGATNPASPGNYSIDVATSANPTATATATYSVVAAAAAPTFDPVATPALVGSASTYTIGVFKATSDIAAGGSIQLTSSAASGTSDNVTFPSAASAYKVDNISTGASAAPMSVVVAGAGGGLSGASVTLQLGSAVSAGQELSVTVNGVINPSTAQTDAISVGAPTGAAATTGTLDVGTSVGATSVSLSQTGAGASGVQYIVGFKATSPVPSGGTVTLVAPAGTSFSGSTVILVDPTRPGASAAVGSGSLTASAVAGSPTANRLVVKVPAAIGAGDQIFVEVGGVTNPSAGSYGGSAGDFTVATSGDAVAAAVPAYTVSAGPAAVQASIEVNPTTPGTAAEYKIGDLRALAALGAGSSTVELEAPVGTIFPSYAGDYTVTDSTTNAAGAHAVAVTGGGTNDAIITLGAAVANGDYLSLTVDSVFNPPSGTYQMSLLGDLSAAVPPVVQPTYTLSLSGSPATATVGQAVTYRATVSPAVTGGTVTFTDNGAALPGCAASPVFAGVATCSVAYSQGGKHSVVAAYTPAAANQAVVTSAAFSETVGLPATGYWLLTRSGQVFAGGAAVGYGGVQVSAATGSVVGIASTPSGNGYWVATSNGTVKAFGDAKSYGDLPSEHVNARDVIAIAPTADGRGYYLVGADGGLFTFGDAHFHGSVPGLHLHVRDVVGMVASPNGAGYLIVGADGGVFTFGSARFYGSIPGLHKHVHDIRAILPASAGTGYVLVGADGGAFVFGKGVHFLGSLPGRRIHVNDIVGLALTPDNGGYFMAGSDGNVYGFGDAVPSSSPAGLSGSLPVVAIAGT